uniref:Uncharacterized protein n=1 Tax=Cacopsylla melanoneura TaxID=428564 RepID=A0A8D8UDH0_9HEMI
MSKVSFLRTDNVSQIQFNLKMNVFPNTVNVFRWKILRQEIFLTPVQKTNVGLVDFLKNRMGHLMSIFRCCYHSVLLRNINNINKAVGHCNFIHWVSKHTMNPVGTHFQFQII